MATATLSPGSPPAMGAGGRSSQALSHLRTTSRQCPIGGRLSPALSLSPLKTPTAPPPPPSTPSRRGTMVAGRRIPSSIRSAPGPLPITPTAMTAPPSGARAAGAMVTPGARITWTTRPEHHPLQGNCMGTAMVQLSRSPLSWVRLSRRLLRLHRQRASNGRRSRVATPRERPPMVCPKGRTGGLPGTT